MRYNLNLEGRDFNCGGAVVLTEFSCDTSYLDGVHKCDFGYTFDAFVQDFADEVSADFACGWDQDWDYFVEENNGGESELYDERGFYVFDDGDMRIAVKHGWGMADTIALTSGEVIARNMLFELALYRAVHWKKFDGLMQLAGNWITTVSERVVERLARAA